MVAGSARGTVSRPEWVAAAKVHPTGEYPAADHDIEVEVVRDQLLGTTLGKFRLLDLIGQGGMGKVYLAEHARIGRKVAIKVLRPKYARRKDIVSRFFQEARAVNQVRNEHIVEISDFVEDEDGQTYLVMELLSGEDLGQLIRREGSIGLDRALRIFIQICNALHAAHKVGIVHRDLKPDNVFLVSKAAEEGKVKDFVKLLDYGVAKLVGAAVAEEEGKLMIGTPAYMSPEQATAQHVDHRADIYSLGAIMYRVLCGRPVFRASTVQEFVNKHLSEAPVPPRSVKELGSKIPRQLEECILKCLEKDRAHRYQTARELKQALEAVEEKVAPTIHLEVAGEGGRRRRRRLLPIALATAGLTAAAVATVFLLRTQGGPESADARVPATEPARVVVVRARPVTRPGADAGAPRTVLNFVSRPLGADVFRVGDPSETALGVTPFSLPLVPAERTEEFVFRLRGYEERTVSVSLGESAEVSVELKRVPGAKVVKGKPAEKAGKPGRKPVEVDRVHTVDPFGK